MLLIKQSTCITSKCHKCSYTTKFRIFFSPAMKSTFESFLMYRRLRCVDVGSMPVIHNSAYLKRFLKIFGYQFVCAERYRWTYTSKVYCCVRPSSLCLTVVRGVWDTCFSLRSWLSSARHIIVPLDTMSMSTSTASRSATTHVSTYWLIDWFRVMA